MTSKEAATVLCFVKTLAKRHRGETGTWTYTPGSVVKSENGDDYDICNMTAATLVDDAGNSTINPWSWKTMKGPHWRM